MIALGQVIASLGLRPVLVDVGASGGYPKIWRGIAAQSVYVCLDPDLREIQEASEGEFQRAVSLNAAVTADPATRSVQFYFTRSPFCSSTLAPDTDALDAYLFADLFAVESESTVRATTLAEVVAQLHLPGIDWLKSDSQGTDLRLLNSLPDALRSRVLAVDIEPGLIDAYRGEDLFVTAHADIVRQGFWLSNLRVQGALRMRQSTLSWLRSREPWLTREFIQEHFRTSPAWCEATYLRTVDALVASRGDRDGFSMLWTFSLLEDQLGFALDLAAEYERRFGVDQGWRLLMEKTLSAAQRRSFRPLMSQAGEIPRWVSRNLRRWVHR